LQDKEDIRGNNIIVCGRKGVCTMKLIAMAFIFVLVFAASSQATVDLNNGFWQNHARTNSVGMAIRSPATTCKDTDGGKEYTLPGSISGTNDETPYLKNDGCSSLYPGQLTEFYCENNKPKSVKYFCRDLGEGYTCESNKCNPSQAPSTPNPSSPPSAVQYASESASDFDGDGCITSVDELIFSKAFQVGAVSGNMYCARKGQVVVRRCPDINQDGKVDVVDLSFLGDALNKCTGIAGFNSKADFNNDGCVNDVDKEIFSVPFAHNGDPRTSVYCYGDGQGRYACPDINQDGAVNTIDMTYFSNNKGKCSHPITPAVNWQPTIITTPSSSGTPSSTVVVDANGWTSCVSKANGLTCSDICRSIGKTFKTTCTTSRGYANFGIQTFMGQGCGLQGDGQFKDAGHLLDNQKKWKCCCG
jgi:hypothetical protein